MNKLFKLCIGAFATAVFLCTLSLQVYAETGTCGTNLNYTISSDGTTLTISGSGAMTDYSSGGSPFYTHRSTLTTLNLGNGVTSIGKYAFQGCSGITEVTIPEGVTSINMYAFYGCKGLKSATVPGSVTAIGINPFGCCISLTGITVAESNSNYTSVDGVLYSKDKTKIVAYPGGKTGSFSIPDSVTEISVCAFIDCESLTSITIPGSVTAIGNSAFSTCTGLKSVTISEGVISIGNAVFSGCSGLEGSLTIPNSVTSIGNTTFYNCTALDDVTVLSTNASFASGTNTFYNVKKVRCFKGSTADKYSLIGDTARAYIQDQSSFNITIAKPADKWIQKVDLYVTAAETDSYNSAKTAPLTQYRVEGDNFIFPVLMYANSYAEDLTYRLRYYYTYKNVEATDAQLSAATAGSADDVKTVSGDNSDLKVYYTDFALDNVKFTIVEEGLIDEAA